MVEQKKSFIFLHKFITSKKFWSLIQNVLVDVQKMFMIVPRLEFGMTGQIVFLESLLSSPLVCLSKA